MDSKARADRQEAQEDLPGSDTFDQEELDHLRAQLEETTQQAQEYLNLLQRTQADFINYRKRRENERQEDLTNTRVTVLGNILPVLDDLTRAVEAAPVGAKGLPWVQGMTMIERKLRAVLEAEGVAEINPVGEDFNPWEQEAVMHEVSAAYPEGKVIEVVRPGYRLDSKVIRPAQVKVSVAQARD